MNPKKRGNGAGGSPAEDTLAQRNPPVEDGPSSSSDDCANSSVGSHNGEETFTAQRTTAHRH
ncbi:hypothetical protein T02_9581 [Trichinella nativa]|uniref:Uncharacterized protein n=1 Tax=Trichinella nativa TaxID=6335 RepID=A0A0V1LL20_9BILA|nr:hypothetical protein T02_9581 [Trichinella nativa]